MGWKRKRNGGLETEGVTVEQETQGERLESVGGKVVGVRI